MGNADRIKKIRTVSGTFYKTSLRSKMLNQTYNQYESDNMKQLITAQKSTQPNSNLIDLVDFYFQGENPNQKGNHQRNG